MKERVNLCFYTFLFLALSFTACNNQSLVEEKFSVKGGQWHMNEVFRAKFPVEDTLSSYNFYLNVRNGGNYPYSNLYVFVKTQFPNGRSSMDTVECILADKTGKWLGSGLGDVLDNQILYRYNRKFPLKGNYEIAMQHAMRDTIVPAILNIGISIEKEEK